jgi:hypothetical protein
MITSGEGIPEFITSEDVYYKRTSNDTNTRSLRDFHNLFVKKNLITGVATRGDTLIDYAVGKAGDLSKWIRSKLSFVFGIDISKDGDFDNESIAYPHVFEMDGKLHMLYLGNQVGRFGFGWATLEDYKP